METSNKTARELYEIVKTDKSRRRFGFGRKIEALSYTLSAGGAKERIGCHHFSPLIQKRAVVKQQFGKKLGVVDVASNCGRA